MLKNYLFILFYVILNLNNSYCTENIAISRYAENHDDTKITSNNINNKNNDIQTKPKQLNYEILSKYFNIECIKQSLNIEDKLGCNITNYNIQKNYIPKDDYFNYLTQCSNTFYFPSYTNYDATPYITITKPTKTKLNINAKPYVKKIDNSKDNNIHNKTCENKSHNKLKMLLEIPDNNTSKENTNSDHAIKKSVKSTYNKNNKEKQALLKKFNTISAILNKTKLSNNKLNENKPVDNIINSNKKNTNYVIEDITSNTSDTDSIINNNFAVECTKDITSKNNSTPVVNHRKKQLPNYKIKNIRNKIKRLNKAKNTLKQTIHNKQNDALQDINVNNNNVNYDTKEYKINNNTSNIEINKKIMDIKIAEQPNNVSNESNNNYSNKNNKKKRNKYRYKYMKHNILHSEKPIVKPSNFITNMKNLGKYIVIPLAISFVIHYYYTNWNITNNN
ncbi:MAG: hypothetical protein IJ848_03810 [Alphaproteobacteria bacterium]|nr:hypothetical protein [Alphaproteobacteria bacterium]